MTPEGAVNRIKQLSTNYTAKQIADILSAYP